MKAAQVLTRNELTTLKTFVEEELFHITFDSDELGREKPFSEIEAEVSGKLIGLFGEEKTDKLNEEVTPSIIDGSIEFHRQIKLRRQIELEKHGRKNQQVVLSKKEEEQRLTQRQAISEIELFCPECKREVSFNAKKCPFCKCNFPQSVCSECFNEVPQHLDGNCPYCGEPL